MGHSENDGQVTDSLPIAAYNIPCIGMVCVGRAQPPVARQNDCIVLCVRFIRGSSANRLGENSQGLVG